jgi:hypothetical protein
MSDPKGRQSLDSLPVVVTTLGKVLVYKGIYRQFSLGNSDLTAGLMLCLKNNVAAVKHSENKIIL